LLLYCFIHKYRSYKSDYKCYFHSLTPILLMWRIW
jgi:hypothetical protein